MPTASYRKPSSHRTIGEYLYGAKLEEHRTCVVRPGKGRITTIYRWLSGVPLRATDDAIEVTWFVIAHPTLAKPSTGRLADSTNRIVSRIDARFAFAVLTTERKAA